MGTHFRIHFIFSTPLNVEEEEMNGGDAAEERRGLWKCRRANPNASKCTVVLVNFKKKLVVLL